MGEYLPILALLVLCTLFGAISILVSRLLNKPRPTSAKVAPYECGIVDQTEPPERFPVRFYLIAMIFIVFDIEIIFLYPWAVIYRDLGSLGLVEVLLFTVAVLVSFVYLLSHGALDWGPAKKRMETTMVSSERTSATTIKRVGTEGRRDGAPVADAEPGEAA